MLFHCPARTLLTGIVLICRCPAGALLTANLRARAAAGGCFRACSSWHVLRRAGLGPVRPALSPTKRKRRPLALITCSKETEPLRAPGHRPFETFAEVCPWRAQKGVPRLQSLPGLIPRRLRRGCSFQAKPCFSPTETQLPVCQSPGPVPIPRKILPQGDIMVLI